jgi:hypothetical protein
MRKVRGLSRVREKVGRVIANDFAIWKIATYQEQKQTS